MQKLVMLLASMAPQKRDWSYAPPLIHCTTSSVACSNQIAMFAVETDAFDGWYSDVFYGCWGKTITTTTSMEYDVKTRL